MNSDTKVVTRIFTNTHCIVCGIAFQTARVGKLYCSTRCKQFGYNHKEQIQDIVSTKQRAINSTPIVFFIDDYCSFNKTQKMLSRYLELSKKRATWNGLNQEIVLNQKLGIHISDHTWHSYTRVKLTEDEESELYEIETELDDRLMGLKGKELSIEQWSFIKSLNPEIDDTSFVEIVVSLSREFISQLTLQESECSNEFALIKHKFINHCNMIGTGAMKFQKRDV